MSTSETITKTDLKNILDEVLPSCAVDYVVEQGTSGDWKYRKWNSGKAEAWVNSSATIAISTASGSIYFGNTSISIPSAIGFLTITHANIEYVGAEGTWTKLTSRSTSAISFSFASSISRSSSARTICGYVVGTWK